MASYAHNPSLERSRRSPSTGPQQVLKIWRRVDSGRRYSRSIAVPQSDLIAGTMFEAATQMAWDSSLRIPMANEESLSQTPASCDRSHGWQRQRTCLAPPCRCSSIRPWCCNAPPGLRVLGKITTTFSTLASAQPASQWEFSMIVTAQISRRGKQNVGPPSQRALPGAVPAN